MLPVTGVKTMATHRECLNAEIARKKLLTLSLPIQPFTCKSMQDTHFSQQAELELFRFRNPTKVSIFWSNPNGLCGGALYLGPMCEPERFSKQGI